jgi:hypothetical protein
VIKAIFQPTNWICLVGTIFWSASSSGWAKNLLTQPQPHFSHFHLPSPLAPVRVVANFFASRSYILRPSTRHSQLWERRWQRYKLMCAISLSLVPDRGVGAALGDAGQHGRLVLLGSDRGRLVDGPRRTWHARLWKSRPGSEKQLNKRLVNCFYGTQIGR